MSYQQAWRVKDYGLNQIRGSPYESFEMLPYYCYNLERKNQGSVTRIKTDHKRVFEMLFIALGASIRTFLNYLRPLLIIDATHLKGEYKGTNLVAVGMDGNNQIMLVAFGICKGETGPYGFQYRGDVRQVDGAFATSWRMLFVIPSTNVVKIIGFTKDDDPIVEVDRGRMFHPLQVYDRTSQEFHSVGISVDGGSFFIGPYKESLILLNV
ncbi:hypothetical protein Tco_1135145 [Tanacetum coccineum]